MNVKYLIVATLETIIKVAVIAGAIVFIFRGATQAYDFGLIADSNLFIVQELLSAHHGKILPGIYDLSTEMTAGQMLEIMSTPVEEADKK